MCMVLFAWLSEQQYFKDYTNINTLASLRDKTEEEIEQDLSPFGFVMSGRDELEYIDGFIYANRYLENNYLLKIDPSSGHVLGKILIPNLEEQYFKGKLANPKDIEVLNTDFKEIKI